MKIIDAHTHIFDALAGFGPRGELRPIGNGRAQWSNGDIIHMIPEGLGDRSFTADTLAQLLRENHVSHAILLQGSFYGFQNGCVLEAAQQYPELFTPSATLDPFCGCASELIHHFLVDQGRRVLKFEASSGGGLMGYHKDFALDGQELAESIALTAQTDTTLVLDVGSPGMASFQPEAVVRIARRYPQMRIVLCHLLAPHPGDEAPLQQALSTLKLDNVWFDMAAMPWNVYPEQYPYPTGLNFLRMAKNTVGAEKLLWGTDVPSVLTRDTYQRLISYITESDVFTAREQELVFAGNAETAYHLI